MIQGHIDSVTRSKIVGWMHSDTVSLSGVYLVAFIDEERVGGGDLGIYREDLLRAGIGDGRGGFSFPIELNSAQDVHAVEIRIQGGNLCLRQADTAIVAREERSRRTPRPPPAPECLA